jgi:hypothetical protein
MKLARNSNKLVWENLQKYYSITRTAFPLTFLFIEGNYKKSVFVRRAWPMAILHYIMLGKRKQQDEMLRNHI